MGTKVTFAPLHKHNTCTGPLAVIHDKCSIFLPLQCCHHRLFFATHPLTDTRRDWAFFFFRDFSLFIHFAGLLDSAAALDTGTFFCCFASMDFRMFFLCCYFLLCKCNDLVMHVHFSFN